MDAAECRYLIECNEKRIAALREYTLDHPVDADPAWIEDIRAEIEGLEAENARLQGTAIEWERAQEEE